MSTAFLDKNWKFLVLRLQACELNWCYRTTNLSWQLGTKVDCSNSKSGPWNKTAYFDININVDFSVILYVDSY